MTFWLLSQLKKLIKALNSGQSPEQLALGVAIGAIIGILPFNGVLTLGIGSLLYFCRTNVALGLVSFSFWSMVAYCLDPLMDRIGLALLSSPSLIGGWTFLYNLPIVPYTQFNNTVMLGSLVMGLLLLIPNYLLMKWLVIQYRERWMTRLQKMKIVQFIKASKVVGFAARLLGDS
ncbi:TIGR03546 family protein [bacterium]|jgi:uncharacterized protein (TIGR03546 family)|nr:TIGR03546 family protein [bacterium]